MIVQGWIELRFAFVSYSKVPFVHIVGDGNVSEGAASRPKEYHASASDTGS